MPNAIVNANPRFTSPPKINKISNTRKIVPEVMMVLLSVSFKLLFIKSPNGIDRWIFSFSLIRSKITTVSLTETPMSVRNAAMTSCVISRFNPGINPLRIERNPKVVSTS